MARELVDGGEAVLEAFRNLDIDYIIASPGSDWPSVWEALARQKINEADGPRYIDTWHETLAVTMAMTVAMAVAVAVAIFVTSPLVVTR